MYRLFVFFGLLTLAVPLRAASYDPGEVYANQYQSFFESLQLYYETPRGCDADGTNDYGGKTQKYNGSRLDRLAPAVFLRAGGVRWGRWRGMSERYRFLQESQFLNRSNRRRKRCLNRRLTTVRSGKKRVKAGCASCLRRL